MPLGSIRRNDAAASGRIARGATRPPGDPRWIADAGSPANALRFVEKIERFCLGLAVASERGTRLRHYSRRHVRAVGFRREVTILFRIEPDLVTILRVHRAGLDWTTSLPQDE